MGKIRDQILETISTHITSIIDKAVSIWTDSPTFYPAAFGAIIAVVSIRTQRKTSREKNSLDFEVSYKRSETVIKAFDELVKAYTNKFDKPLADWGKRENARTTEGKALSTIFNEWERCANAVKHKIYDDAYLYKVYGSTVLDLDERFGEYVAACQKWNPRVYNNFKWLALRWRVRRSYEDVSHKAMKNKRLMDQIEKLLRELKKNS